MFLHMSVAQLLTMPVCAELTHGLDPYAFVALTFTKKVWPRSPDRIVWRIVVEGDVAEATVMQFVPVLLQRNHWYVYDVTPFFQVPADAVKVWPTAAVPPIVGAAVFAGFAPTVPVAADVADAPEPAAFAAVTRSLIRWPRSGDPGVYEVVVADVVLLVIRVQLLPAESHRSQSYS
jgi:hypothetical protein